MAILAECPVCHRKVTIKKKFCKCGADLDAEKKAKRVVYHIVYRMDGKQVWKALSSFEGVKANSIEAARAVESKFVVCKRENRLEVFNVKPDATMTFRELSEWYLALPKVKALKSYGRSMIALNRFNERLGQRLVKDIKPIDLETYQAARKGEGISDGTIDMELKMAKAVINKAFDNEMVSGKVLRVFKAVRNLLKVGSNIRDRVLNVQEAEALIAATTGDIKHVLITAYETGMRRTEILGLTWDRVSVKDKIISLGETKNGRPRVIPMTEKLFATLYTMPRGLKDKHVFLSNGKPIEEMALRRSIKAACEATGVLYGRSKDGFTLHNLRHTVNTDLRRAGVQESVINAIIGHVENTMFARYNTIDLEDLRGAMSRLEAYRTSVRQNVSFGSQVI